MSISISGPVKLSQLGTEVGQVVGTTVRLGQTDVRSLMGAPSGTVDMYNSHGKAPGLVLHLDAQNIQSYTGTSTWYDLSGNALHGTISGSPVFNSTQGSLIYDGINDITYCPHNAAVDIRRTFTISVWFKMYTLPATGLWTNLVSKQSSPAAALESRTYSLWINSVGTLYLCTADPTGQEYITLNLSINVYSNFIGVVDRNTGTLSAYMNGVQAATGSVRTTDTTSHTNPVCVGQATVGSYAAFNGEIAVVQIFNRALTSSDALNHFNAFKSRFGLT